MKRFIKRLRMAWGLRMWPWQIPASTVTWLQWPQKPVTERDKQRTRVLAAKHGWEKPTKDEREQARTTP